MEDKEEDEESKNTEKEKKEENIEGNESQYRLEKINEKKKMKILMKM